jgi:hypothetical protein
MLGKGFIASQCGKFPVLSWWFETSGLPIQVPCSPSQNGNGVPLLQMNGVARDSGGSPEPRSSGNCSSSADDDHDSDYESARCTHCMLCSKFLQLASPGLLRC